MLEAFEVSERSPHSRLSISIVMETVMDDRQGHEKLKYFLVTEVKSEQNYGM